MRKILTAAVFAALGLLLLAACGEGEFNPDFAISVVSREAGSGTRGAFVDIVGLNVGGSDQTLATAEIAGGTSQVITNVANNMYAIGYIALGSLGDNVRAVPIGGVQPTAANVLSGAYPISRPLYIALRRDSESALRDDFVAFILSREGQAIAAAGYVPALADAAAFAPAGVSGSLQVAGSTSVYPLMARLAEAYGELTGNRVEVLSMGTTAGITQAIEGTVDLGMASRPLTAQELESVDAVAIALDGLVVIVHPDNPLAGLTLEEVRRVFVGEITRWSGLGIRD